MVTEQSLTSYLQAFIVLKILQTFEIRNSNQTQRIRAFTYRSASKLCLQLLDNQSPFKSLFVVSLGSLPHQVLANKQCLRCLLHVFVRHITTHTPPGSREKVLGSTCLLFCRAHNFDGVFIQFCFLFCPTKWYPEHHEIIIVIISVDEESQIFAFQWILLPF